mmetsp:Transcript_3966/g.11911  ORF Transcript_3966/g.11911 Transcript_3966/m.11911 type:complete len:587 (-) Transcript_3966:73-1833(-)
MMELNPVRLVVKHTFLEFECNGQNSRACAASHRRRSDSKIEYGLPLAEEALARVQVPSAGSSTAVQPGDSEEVLQAAVETPTVTEEQTAPENPPEEGEEEEEALDEREEDTQASSHGSLHDDEEEDFDVNGLGKGLETRRKSTLSSFSDSRDASVGGIDFDTGLLESEASGLGPLVGDLMDDDHDLIDYPRRRQSTCSVVTDPGDFLESSPWLRHTPALIPPPAHVLTPNPPPQPQHAEATGQLPGGCGTAEPPCGYPPSGGTFGGGLPASLDAPPGLSDGRLSRSYAAPPFQVPQPPYHLPPQVPQPPTHHAALAAFTATASAAYAGSNMNRHQTLHVAGRDGQCFATAAGAGAGWPTSRPVVGSWMDSRGELGAGRGYYNPAALHQPLMAPPGPPVHPPHMDAGCRNALLGLQHAYHVTQQAQVEQPKPRTTVMLRNLPEGFSRSMLIRMLDEAGFVGFYDFVYMPMNFRTKSSFGYAFVNLVAPHVAQYCYDHFQGFRRWGVQTDKVCEVSWSDMHQGLMAHIHRYRNSPVMHESVPDEYKPVVYARGVRVPFPPPTKKLRVPRIRRSPEGFGDDLEDDGEDM